MGKPFSDLEKRALAILANGGNPASSQDQELAKYWAWKINPSLASHDLPAASERPEGRKLLELGLKPFGMNLPANTYAKVTISQRSSDFATAAVRTELKTTTIAGANVGYRLARFTPAKVYARTGAATESTERTSRITGRAYKSYFARADQGYTMPFGDSDGGGNVQARQEAIATAIRGLENQSIGLITFSPEKLKA